MEVAIGPDGIKIEEEKVKAVLDWPVPKSVKDVQKFWKILWEYQDYYMS